jgi:hypothetical protein
LAVGKALLAKPQFPVVKRHIEQEAHCETCGVPEESIQHVFWSGPLQGSSGHKPEA